MVEINESNYLFPNLVPTEIRALFGDPPLLRGEDARVYNGILDKFTSHIEPKEMIEWWWVKDLTDHTWEIRRLRRFKVLFVEYQRDFLHDCQEAHANVGGNDHAKYVRVPLPDSESDSAGLFRNLVNDYTSVDRLIASAEKRRTQTLREIERRRKALAQDLREASDEIADGGSDDLPLAA